MILTDDMLEPYRDDRGFAHLQKRFGRYGYSDPIPDSYFSTTTDVFPTIRIAAGRSFPPSSLSVALVFAFMEMVPRLDHSRQWIALDHQAGGYTCEQILMIATELRIKQDIRPTLERIAVDGFMAESGHFDRFGLRASRLCAYNETLKEIGLDCEASWRHLTESVYPVDATQENLDCIAEDPPLIETMADWSNFPRARFSSNPVILFLSENSD